MYSVKEIFYTLQGEGAQSGRPAVFLRFAGCNLWSGREEDRAKAVCQFCDTDFVGTDGVNGGRFGSADELAAAALAVAGVRLAYEEETDGIVTDAIVTGAAVTDAIVTDAAVADAGGLMIVLTGGEPLLQVDAALIKSLKRAGFFIAVETNGTINAPEGLDWICVSPKAGSDVIQRQGDELKVVYGQEGLALDALLTWDFSHFYLQPMDGNDIDRLTRETIGYCKAHPAWKLSLQTHKILQIP